MHRTTTGDVIVFARYFLAEFFFVCLLMPSVGAGEIIKYPVNFISKTQIRTVIVLLLSSKVVFAHVIYGISFKLANTQAADSSY